MTWKHPLSIENDFGNVSPVEHDLHILVKVGTVSWSQTFKGVQMPVGGSDTVNLCFAAALTAGEAATLNNTLIPAYVYVKPGVLPVNNLVAIEDPQPTNDETAAGGGFAPGSAWYNKQLKRTWECKDATENAAKWTLSNVRAQSVVVDAAGGGDYTSIAVACAAGNHSVFVKNGLYVETADIVLAAHGAQVIGETMGGVTVLLNGGNTLRCDSSQGNAYKVGTLSCVHNTNTVTGVGTAWNTAGNVAAGQMIMISENYYTIASVESDISLTLADTYNGNTVAGLSYLAQDMYLGVRIHNLILANSSSTGLFLRGLRNSTVYGVAIKGCSPNIHVQMCGNIGIVNGASEKSTGDGILIDECVSVRIDTMGFSNCTACGISVQNGASAVVIGGSSSNSNKQHGVYIGGDSKFVNVNDTVVRNNKLKGIYGETSTQSVVVVNCDTCQNGTHGIDILGPNNSVSDSPVMNNGGHGINVGDLSIISDNHVLNNGGDGLNLVTSDNCVVASNTIDGNGGDGVAINGSSNVVGLNRIQNNVGWGIRVQGGAHNTLAHNYNCTSNTAGNVSDGGGTRTRHSSSVTHHTIDPTPSDDVTQKVVVGDTWLNTISKRFFICMTNGVGTAEWSGGVAAPTTALTADSTNAAGSALTLSASDHSHALDFAAGKIGGLVISGGAATGENLELRANAADTTTGYILAHSGVCTRTSPSTTKTSSTLVVLAAAEVLGGCIPVSPTAAHNLQLPTAAQLVGEMGEGATVGDSFQFAVVHAAGSAYAVTLTMGAGCTLFGSPSISNNTVAMAASFLVRCASVTPLGESCTVYRMS